MGLKAVNNHNLSWGLLNFDGLTKGFIPRRQTVLCLCCESRAEMAKGQCHSLIWDQKVAPKYLSKVVFGLLLFFAFPHINQRTKWYELHPAEFTLHWSNHNRTLMYVVQLWNRTYTLYNAIEFSGFWPDCSFSFMGSGFLRQPSP